MSQIEANDETADKKPKAKENTSRVKLKDENAKKEPIVVVVHDNTISNEMKRLDDDTLAMLEASKMYSDTKLSDFMSEVEKRVELNSGVITPEQIKQIEWFYDFCSSYVDMKASEATPERVLALVNSIKERREELKIHDIDIPRIVLHDPSEENTNRLREIVKTYKVRTSELKHIKDSIQKWRVWGKGWLKKNRLNSEISTSVKKEELLLCRICERMIPASDMEKHSTQYMLDFNREQQMKEFELSLASIMRIFEENMREIKKKANEPSYVECADGWKIEDDQSKYVCSLVILSYIFRSKRHCMQVLLCQIPVTHTHLLDLLNQMTQMITHIKQFNDSRWNEQEHKDLVEELIRLFEAHLQDPIVEIEDLCQQGVDIFRDRLRQLRNKHGHHSPSLEHEGKHISIQDFEFVKPISKGAYGRVFLARKKNTGDLYAIKVMNKKKLLRKNQNQHIQAERRIMAHADNPFVVKLFYSFQSKNHLYLVMEFVNGGDMYSMLKNVGSLNEETVKVYAAELVLALSYLHEELHVIHRDLKPDNILISNKGFIKLIDFGLSQIGVAERTANKRDSMPFIIINHHHSSASQHTSREPSNRSHEPSACSSDPESLHFSSHNKYASFDKESKHYSGRMETPSYNGDSVESPGRKDPSTPEFSLHSSSSAIDQHNSWLHSSGSYETFTTSMNSSSTSSMSYASSQFSSLSSLNISGLDSSTSSASPSLYSNSFNSMNSSGYQDRRAITPAKSNLKTQKGGADEDSDEEYVASHSTATPTRVLTKEQIKRRQDFRRLHRRKEKLSRVGTPDYMAPELLLGTYSGPANDWWSVGAIVYELLVGFPPFNDATPEIVFHRIVNKDMEWPMIPEEMSCEAYDFINRLLDLDPHTRLGSKGSKEVKEHPFFSGIVWSDLENAMCEVPFVPEVEDQTDTSYFIDRYSDENDVTKSFRLSLTRPVGGAHRNGLIESIDADNQTSSSDDKEAIDDKVFAGFDYSNVFNLKEINDEKLAHRHESDCSYTVTTTTDAVESSSEFIPVHERKDLDKTPFIANEENPVENLEQYYLSPILNTDNQTTEGLDCMIPNCESDTDSDGRIPKEKNVSKLVRENHNCELLNGKQELGLKGKEELGVSLVLPEEIVRLPLIHSESDCEEMVHHSLIHSENEPEEMAHSEPEDSFQGDPDEDFSNDLSFFDLKVEESGDYVNYTFDFQNNSD